MHVITLRGEFSGKGKYGKFFPLSKTRGVKVLHRGAKTIRELKASNSWYEAMEEAKLIQAIRAKVRIVPKCYGIGIFRFNRHSNYYVGIIMENLGSTTLYSLDMCQEQSYLIRDNLRWKLSKLGFHHRDLHEFNIMVQNNKFYVIDFSPDFSYAEDKAA